MVFCICIFTFSFILFLVQISALELFSRFSLTDGFHFFSFFEQKKITCQFDSCFYLMQDFMFIGLFLVAIASSVASDVHCSCTIFDLNIFFKLFHMAFSAENSEKCRFKRELH